MLILGVCLLLIEPVALFFCIKIDKWLKVLFWAVGNLLFIWGTVTFLLAGPVLDYMKALKKIEEKEKTFIFPVDVILKATESCDYAKEKNVENYRCPAQAAVHKIYQKWHEHTEKQS